MRVCVPITADGVITPPPVRGGVLAARRLRRSVAAGLRGAGVAAHRGSRRRLLPGSGGPGVRDAVRRQLDVRRAAGLVEAVPSAAAAQAGVAGGVGQDGVDLPRRAVRVVHPHLVLHRAAAAGGVLGQRRQARPAEPVRSDQTGSAL